MKGWEEGKRGREGRKGGREGRNRRDEGKGGREGSRGREEGKGGREGGCIFITLASSVARPEVFCYFDLYL